MPRNGSGVFSLVPSYLAVTGQTIEASQHNPPLEDIAVALTGSLPVNGSAPMLAPINMAGSRILNLGTPTGAADAATKAYIDAAIAAVTALVVTIPPGIVGHYAGGVVPTGWLLCNGAAVSRTTYAALFAAIGTIYGPGDGTTTFQLPELRGEFTRFSDLGRGQDPGRTVGTIQAQEIQAHGHGVNDPGHVHLYDKSPALGSGVGPGGFNASTWPWSVTATSSAGTGISIQATGGTETRPRNVSLTAIIKV